MGEGSGRYVALDETELPAAIARALADSARGEQLSSQAPAGFLERIKAFIQE
jgi:hypothetical protein